MGFELMEIKNNGSHYEFIIRETVMNNILNWQDLPDVGAIKEYLKEHHLPKDKLYPEKEFLEEAEGTGYIHLWVEKRKTADQQDQQ